MNVLVVVAKIELVPRACDLKAICDNLFARKCFKFVRKLFAFGFDFAKLFKPTLRSLTIFRLESLECKKSPVCVQ